MLDGRVLGASQVEYKPFGKPPLKREACHSEPRLFHPEDPGLRQRPALRRHYGRTVAVHDLLKGREYNQNKAVEGFNR